MITSLHSEEANHNKGELSKAIASEITTELLTIKVQSAIIDKVKELTDDLGESFFTNSISDSLFKKVVLDARRWCSGGNLSYFKTIDDQNRSLDRFKASVGNIKRSLGVSREYDERDKETIAKILTHIKK